MFLISNTSLNITLILHDRNKKEIVKLFIQIIIYSHYWIDDRDTIVEQGFVPTTDPNE